MKVRWVVLLLVLLAGALGALHGENEFDNDTGGAVERHATDRVAPPLAGHDPTPSVPADRGPTLAGGGTEGPEPSGDSGETVGAVPGRAETVAVEVVAAYAGDVPAGWHEALPAQQPHAIRPPRPRGPVVGSAGSGGVGPTGHWSRFPPPAPPRGDATIRVAVRDLNGVPIPGADVYLGPRDSLHGKTVSFGDLRRLGATDESGELLAEDLPAGAAVLAANAWSQLNGPRGLDAGSSIPVLLVSRATVSARVTLPLDTGAFGAVSGRVLDEQDRPVARAEIRCGFFRTYADEQGRFEAPHLPTGIRTVTARRNGYAPGSLEVDVPPGGTREVAVRLAWAESGGLTLAGRVLTADGAGLAGATLYLIDEGGRGTLRSVRSGAEGRYVFEDLPERLRTVPVRIQADKFRAGYRATNIRLEDGIVDARLDIRLPPRQVQVRFRLTDAGTSRPVDRCRIEVERLDVADASARGFTGRRPDGVYEHFYPAGRYRFGVEAPDRETQVLEVDLAPPGGELDLDVRFPSTWEPGVQVTLRVRVLDLTTDAPVTTCSIVVLDDQRREIARFVGSAPDGRYSLPASSGPGVLRVSAEGYETAEESVELAADGTGLQVVSHLAPR